MAASLAAEALGVGSTLVVVALRLFTLNVLRNAAAADFVRG